MFGGKTWGYPVGVEAIALVYNKDLVDAPPATFEEIATMPVKKDGVSPDHVGLQQHLLHLPAARRPTAATPS